MHASNLFTIALATLATSAAVNQPSSSVIETRFNDNSVGRLEARSSSQQLQARACNCGAIFSCSGSVSSCCSGTGGFGMCNTSSGSCMCGTECNPFQCSQRP